ncbi:MAG: hypothetical protein IZT59_10860 [Verrucomicrobia bacterium]|nr:hypothetical protein [Verrucomicrobiota bacterium]
MNDETKKHPNSADKLRRRLLTPEHCLKLGRYFGNEPENRFPSPVK